MKTFNFLSKNKITILMISLILVISIPFACSKKIAFENSSIVPAARGEVSVKKDNNENYKIEIKISNLAEPDRLNPPKSTYVVWLESQNKNPQNIGQIVGTTNLHVKFETVSAYKPRRIFITAENEANTQYPSYMRILETALF